MTLVSSYLIFRQAFYPEDPVAPDGVEGRTMHIALPDPELNPFFLQGLLPLKPWYRCPHLHGLILALIVV